MDKYGLDGHKLAYHMERVAAWQKGENIYPIYMEISPSGMCNHRCTFCALDFMGYQKRFLDSAILAQRLAEMGRLGLKSIMFGGEGEPLLHKDIGPLAQAVKSAGIDVAFTTNAVLLNERKMEQILPVTEWIKVSCNAGTAATYAKIHRTKEADFQRVLDNLARAASFKRRTGGHCTLGLQLLLLPENREEVLPLATLARQIGMDYLVVKPYSQHPASGIKRYKDLTYGDVTAICREAVSLSNDDFQVIIRAKTMQYWDRQDRHYDRCLALPFWSYIDAGGNVWGCSMFLDDERFCYGNINDQTFEEIWQGDRRQQSLRWVADNLDARECRVNCRMDKINRYLWELSHPPAHVNFI